MILSGANSVAGRLSFGRGWGMGLAIRAAFLTGWLVATASAASACSCEVPSQGKAFRKAWAVFVGQVVEIDQREYREDEPDGEQLVPYAVKFRVESYWKGVKASEIVVLSDQGLLPCHLGRFVVGERYLVYAHGEHLLATLNCDRSRPVDAAAEDLRKLGKPKGSFAPHAPPDN